jgi:oxygen-dependent protoporphyrinogen oxidase
VHNKFCHRAPSGKILLRCFLGGTRDSEALNLSDDEILSVVRSELGAILNFSSSPLFYRIYRWPFSMPQYVVGHAERLKTIENRLKNLPGLYLAGNAYSGVGISDCIREGKAAAERAIQECLR